MSDTASSPGTMRGWAINGYGGEIVLMDDLPVSTPGSRDVLIRCAVPKSASGMNWCAPTHATWGASSRWCWAWAARVRSSRWAPIVKGFAAGQYVYAYSYPLADNGSWAEYVLVPDNYVARAPASITPCANDYEHNVRACSGRTRCRSRQTAIYT